MGSLRAFEASARLLSFTRAAEELRVTQGAVSRRVANLEDLFGFPLFNRSASGLTLTAAGETYLREIRPCLNRIDATTTKLIASGGAGGTLNLAVIPTFGTRWLIPRLTSFARQYPSIVINILTRHSPFDFESEGLDAAIHFGDQSWPRAVLERLMHEETVVVCKPELANPEQGLNHPVDLIQPGRTLLQHLTRPDAWSEWFRTAGVEAFDTSRGPVFEQIEMTITAALSGLGYALVPRFLAETEINRGLLVMPFAEIRVRSESAYWLVFPEDRRSDPVLRVFRDWLLAEVSESKGLT
jgi:LysR family transcriptional regulator, glycine cleavage system transcriptional activator